MASSLTCSSSLKAYSCLAIAVLKQALDDEDYDFFLKDSESLFLFTNLAKVTDKDINSLEIEKLKKAKIQKEKDFPEGSRTKRIRPYLDGSYTSKEISELLHVPLVAVYEAKRRTPGASFKYSPKGAKKKRERELQLKK